MRTTRCRIAIVDSASPLARLPDPLQNDQRDLPFGLLLVSCKIGHLGGLGIVEPLPFFPCRRPGSGGKAFGANLDCHLWVCHQVMIPVGMGVSTPFGGDDNDAVAVGGVVERVDARQPAQLHHRRRPHHCHRLQRGC